MEFVSDVKLITAGDKVGASEATLLAKLGIKPFSYGLIIKQVLISTSLILLGIGKLGSPPPEQALPAL